MKEIRGAAKNIRDLLQGKKFAIDYYQREYRWESKHVRELVDDLTGAFLENYVSGHKRTDVGDYGRYFLGSIITSDGVDDKFIIDGQQRLTTLTLILIHLHESVEDQGLKETISQHIYSTRLGTRSFNLNIPTRLQCMNYLFNRGQVNPPKVTDQSIRNTLDRYGDVEAALSEALPERDEVSGAHVTDYFADWLIECVYIVDITAGSDADAYTIFETMNDRGLSLTPAEMLRGYLLANIRETDRREATEVWDYTIRELRQLGEDEGAKSIQAWLRSQHAQTIRSSGGRAAPEDFDRIGSEFHRWVGDERDCLGLGSSTNYVDFIQRDFKFYSRWYREIVQAGLEPVEGLEPFYYVGQTTFTLQYMAALAPLVPGDSDYECKRKLRVVATAIDCILNRRIWNFQSIGQTAMRVRMFQQFVLKIRQLEIAHLVDALCRLLDGGGLELRPFEGTDFRLHGNNGPNVFRILARLTHHVESKSERAGRYEDYFRRGRDSYQVEHVLAQSHRDDEGLDDFDHHRNRLGALVLLPRSINPSLGDMRFEDKREHYLKENLLASSLHERAYERNPGFNGFIRESGLPFKPYEVFDVDAINERQELYRQLAEQIWSTDSIRKAAEA